MIFGDIDPHGLGEFRAAPDKHPGCHRYKVERMLHLLKLQAILKHEEDVWDPLSDDSGFVMGRLWIAHVDTQPQLRAAT